MRTRLLACAAAAGAALAPLAAWPVAAAPPPKAVALELLGRYSSGVFNAAAAEITAHDPLTQRLFTVNAQAGEVDVLSVADPTAPVKVGTVRAVGVTDVTGAVIGAGASVNSVDVHDGLLAVAVQAPVKTDRGWVALFRTTGELLGAVRSGVQPDMVAFTPDGTTVVTADEAEPAHDFSTDPEGTVTLVDVATLTTRTARFTAFEGAALPPGVRVFGPDVAVPAGQATAGRVARNLEPEYVTFDQQSKRAWVTLQEANAVAELDLASGAFTDLWALPAKDWSTGANRFDASDREVSSSQGRISIRNWPVKSLPMPDAIASYQVRGTTYLVTANEGDAREWGRVGTDPNAYAEPARVSTLTLCATEFPDGAALKANGALGRLNVTRASGFDAARGCYSELYAFGGRSFSVFDEDGNLVLDSGALLEETVAGLVASGDLPEKAFNASNDGAATLDNRSDDKGPEPEGVVVGKVGGRSYAFVALERIGGVMAFDVTDPRRTRFLDFVNARDYDNSGLAAGDLGAEGITFVAAEDSPSGSPLVVIANEVSGTTTLFRVDELG
jgi:hypothetical protein